MLLYPPRWKTSSLVWERLLQACQLQAWVRIPELKMLVPRLLGLLENATGNRLVPFRKTCMARHWDAPSVRRVRLDAVTAGPRLALKSTQMDTGIGRSSLCSHSLAGGAGWQRNLQLALRMSEQHACLRAQGINVKRSSSQDVTISYPKIPYPQFVRFQTKCD